MYSVKLGVREEGGSGCIYMKFIALYLKQGWITCFCVMVKDTAFLYVLCIYSIMISPNNTGILLKI